MVDRKITESGPIALAQRMEEDAYHQMIVQQERDLADILHDNLVMQQEYAESLEATIVKQRVVISRLQQKLREITRNTSQQT